MSPYLTRSELAELLKITTSGVDQAVKRGTIPPPIRLSERFVRFRADQYTPEALASWTAANPRPASGRRGRPAKAETSTEPAPTQVLLVEKDRASPAIVMTSSVGGPHA